LGMHLRGCLLAVLAAASSANMAIAPSDGCVVLTGANGFLAGYIAEVLLEKGYTVHGTVRPSTLAKQSKVQFLYDMDAKLPGKLKLFPAELVRSAFDVAAKTCSSILITAFPMVKGMADKNGSDPAFLKYQVDAGMQGSYAAMEVAKKFGLKKAVLTTSVATMCPTKAKNHLKLGDTPYNEKDWNDLAALGHLNYAYAKMQSEKAAYDWNKQHGEPLELASVAFPYAVAPPKCMDTYSSFSLFKMVLGGEMGPFYLPVDMHVVHMRDVARAHVHVMEHSSGKGRFIVSPPPAQSHYPMWKTSALFKRRFPDYPVATIPLPGLALKFAPDTDLEEILAQCQNGFDGNKIAHELGFEYQHLDMESSVLDMAEAAIAAGIVAKGKMLVASEITLVTIASLMVLVLACAKCCLRKSKVE